MDNLMESVKAGALGSLLWYACGQSPWIGFATAATATLAASTVFGVMDPLKESKDSLKDSATSSLPAKDLDAVEQVNEIAKRKILSARPDSLKKPRISSSPETVEMNKVDSNQKKSPVRKEPRKQPQPVKSVVSISKGLPNIGNTCWLNSIIKLLFTTDQYDSLLSIEGLNPNDPTIPLREVLSYIVGSLRNGDEEELDGWMHAILIELEGLKDRFIEIPENIGAPLQRDAGEMLLMFLNVLNYKPSAGQKLPQEVYYYEPMRAEDQKYAKPGSQRTLDFPCLTVQIPSEIRPEETVNMSDILNGKVEDKENTPIIIDPEKDENIRAPLHKYKFLMDLPEHLLITVNRNRYVNNAGALTLEKLKNPIEWTVDGKGNAIISLKEYEPIKDRNGKIQTAVEVRTHFYAVEGFISHLGESQGGHYVAYEKEQGVEGFIEHNDDKQPARPRLRRETFFREWQLGQSTVLRLRRIKTQSFDKM
jgi:uncharacterized UBP type Zn finger protein